MVFFFTWDEKWFLTSMIYLRLSYFLCHVYVDKLKTFFQEVYYKP